MAARARTPTIQHVRFSRRHPAVRVDVLATLLELDLLMGRRTSFRRHLRRALNDACAQGTQIVNAVKLR